MLINVAQYTEKPQAEHLPTGMILLLLSYVFTSFQFYHTAFQNTIMKINGSKNKDVYVNWFNVAPGVWGMKDTFVNVYMIHNPSDNKWVLVDAGLKWSAPKIRKMAEHLFWPEVRPSAIVLTHGHFDHVGSVSKLAEEWEVPVYAHRMERPYLNGTSSYPPPDPTVGGGMMATLSFLYPKGPINIENVLQMLPDDGSIPGLPEWRYMHTPGHTAGHISLFRERDRVLISGDAFVSTKAESTLAVMTDRKQISGPPKYFTPDWNAAEQSVQQLAALEPEIVATGHGRPMHGEEMRKSLHTLADNFNEEAKPSHGRYVNEPAQSDENGVSYIPKHTGNTMAYAIAGITAVALISFFLFRKKSKPGISWEKLSTGTFKPSQLRKSAIKLGQEGIDRLGKEGRNIEKLGKKLVAGMTEDKRQLDKLGMKMK
jgi:glyoxylase-like metal-dependent hydrolase (beta-lactamase superfamily II)